MVTEENLRTREGCPVGDSDREPLQYPSVTTLCEGVATAPDNQPSQSREKEDSSIEGQATAAGPDPCARHGGGESDFRPSIPSTPLLCRAHLPVRLLYNAYAIGSAHTPPRSCFAAVKPTTQAYFDPPKIIIGQLIWPISTYCCTKLASNSCWPPGSREFGYSPKITETRVTHWMASTF